MTYKRNNSILRVPQELIEATNSIITAWLIGRINIDLDLLTSKIIEMTEKWNKRYQSLDNIEKNDTSTSTWNSYPIYESVAARYINPTHWGTPLPENVIAFTFHSSKPRQQLLKLHSQANTTTPAHGRPHDYPYSSSILQLCICTENYALQLMIPSPNIPAPSPQSSSSKSSKYCR